MIITNSIALLRAYYPVQSIRSERGTYIFDSCSSATVSLTTPRHPGKPHEHDRRSSTEKNLYIRRSELAK